MGVDKRGQLRVVLKFGSELGLTPVRTLTRGNTGQPEAEIASPSNFIDNWLACPTLNVCGEVTSDSWAAAARYPNRLTDPDVQPSTFNPPTTPRGLRSLPRSLRSRLHRPWPWVIPVASQDRVVPNRRYL